jgi:hypothetical protein
MGHWKLLLSIIGLAGIGTAWQHHPVDYKRYPPTVVIVGAARDTLNAAYDTYASADSSAPLVEQGFCAQSWTTYRPSWNTTIVRITRVVRSEINASPISVSIPCAQPMSVDAGIVFHTHPPQQCVIKGNWTEWSNCTRSSDLEAECHASGLDMADTLQHPGFPARFIVCGDDRFVLYHATQAL